MWISGWLSTVSRVVCLAHTPWVCSRAQILDDQGSRIYRLHFVRNYLLPMAIALVTGTLAGCHVPSLGPTFFSKSLPERDTSLSKRDDLPIAKDLPPKDSSRLLMALAEEELQAGFDREAEAHYEQARRLDPASKGAAHRLALIHDSRGEHGLAQSEYTKALKENPQNADILNDFGYSYYSQGDWKRAEELYRKAIEQKDDPRFWNNLGLAIGQQERYREALNCFRKATGEAQASGNLGFVYLAQGRKESARKAYEHALELDPNFNQARQVLKQIEDELGPAPARKLSRPLDLTEETIEPAEESPEEP